MSKNGNVRSILGFFVLIIVVLVLVVLYDKSMRTNTPTPEQPVQDAAAVATSTADTTRILIGVPKPMESTDLAYLYDEENNTLTRLTQPGGWRVTDGTHANETRFEPATNDPTATMLVEPGLHPVVLRDEAGVAYQNPIWIDRLDETTAAIQADKDERYLLFVHMNGKITEVYTFPELYKIHGVYGNAVWISTAVPGAGLESAPQGPADILRIDETGVTTMATEDNAVDVLVAFDRDSFAYGFSNGNYKAQHGDSRVEGRGRPLMWLNAQELLVADGKDLKRINVVESREETIGTLDGAATVARRQSFLGAE